MTKMSKLLKTLLIGLILAISLTTPLNAQEIVDTEDQATKTEEDNNEKYLRANINISSNIEVNKNSLFDASLSYIPENSTVTSYKWDFGDGNSNEGIEVFHLYKDPGKYTVKLSIKTENYESIEEKEIFVYNKLILLITDLNESKEIFATLKSFAETQNTYLEIIDAFGSNTEFISEEILSKKINENTDEIKKAQQIVIWTKEFAGLNALSRYTKNKENSYSLQNKSIIIIDNKYSSHITRIENLIPKNTNNDTIIAMEGAIYPIIESLNKEDLIEKLDTQGHSYTYLEEKSKSIKTWNFMSHFVKILINQGIPDNTIALLLLLPVIVTFITFIRQVVGITTPNLFTPTIMTLSFLILGMGAGLTILITALFVGITVKTLLKNTNMLFTPKLSISLTSLSITLLILLTLNIYLNIFNFEYLSLAIFPMLILSTLIENLVKVKDNKIIKESFKLIISTTLAALAAFALAGGEITLGILEFQFTFIKTIMLDYPELIILLLILNIIMGKWTGLKILERYRFKELLRHIEEEE